eukprot:3717720-Rhodomonas_salina.4
MITTADSQDQKHLSGVELVGQHEVEQRPQLAHVVLEWRSCDEQPAGRGMHHVSSGHGTCCR